MKKNATIVFLEPMSFMEIAQYPVHQTYNVSLTDNNLTAEISMRMVLYYWHTLGTSLTEKQLLQFFLSEMVKPEI